MNQFYQIQNPWHFKLWWWARWRGKDYQQSYVGFGYMQTINILQNVIWNDVAIQCIICIKMVILARVVLSFAFIILVIQHCLSFHSLKYDKKRKLKCITFEPVQALTYKIEFEEVSCLLTLQAEAEQYWYLVKQISWK